MYVQRHSWPIIAAAAVPECASRDLGGTGHAIETFALSDNRAAHATDDRYTVTFGVIRLRC